MTKADIKRFACDEDLMRGQVGALLIGELTEAIFCRLGKKGTGMRYR